MKRSRHFSLPTLVCWIGYADAVGLIFWITGASENDVGARFMAAVGAMVLGMHCMRLDAEGR